MKRAKKGGKPGRPAYKPEEKQRARVEELAARGVPQKTIARLVGVACETLRKHFPDELDLGATKADEKVVGKLYELALSGNVPACIFWTKARLGWRDHQSISLENPDGSPLSFTLKLEDHARGDL